LDPRFDKITNQTYATWAHTSTAQQALAQAGYSGAILGQHYFVTPSPGAAIAPKWDFTSSGATKGNKNAFVIGAKDVGVAGARPTIDVPSLQLHNTSGALATTIYRLESVNGQPPASCSGSGALSVKYTALYCASAILLGARSEQDLIASRRPHRLPCLNEYVQV
jgi:hypothetical protein